nr:glycosyltransferase family 2 protein [Desulfobacula sp.]
MDSDVEVFSGTIDGLIAALEKNHHTGLAVPKIIYPDGRLQKSTDSFPTIGRKIYRYCFLKKMEKTDALKPPSNEVIAVDYAISAFWIMKKNVLDKIGLMDEKIFYSPEDVDYCLRIWKSDYAIAYIPFVSVVHHTQEISRGFKLNTAFFNHIKGLFYLFFKHRYFLKPPAFRVSL